MLFIKSWGLNGATKQDKYPAETVVNKKPPQSRIVNQGFSLTTELLKSHVLLGHYEYGF